MTRIEIIGIAGPSCSGKTTIARRLAERLGPDRAIEIPLDAYYRDLGHLSIEERAQQNFDTPEAIESTLLLEQLHALEEGREILRPAYCYETHTRLQREQWVRHSPSAEKTVVIVEGVFALYWDVIASMMGTRVFVGAPWPLCLERRMLRDAEGRGRHPDAIRKQFERDVLPMYEQYVEPTMKRANVILDGSADVEKSVESILHALSTKPSE